MKNNIFPAQDAKKIAQRMATSIAVQNRMFLAERRNPPSIAFYEDEKQYFDSEANKIHLGMYGPIEYFKVEDEETYIAGVEYLFGHENQHVRSTASVPYKNGIMKSTFAIIEWIARKEGFTKAFRNERDYVAFLSTDLKNKGIYVSYKLLQNVCAGIANSVEDGRIERIRSKEFPGFEAQRKYFRAVVWNEDHKYKPYGDMDANDILNIHLCAILSLATTGLYPKGYVVQYANTPIMDEIQKMMPYIAKAVLAGKTRYMADNLVEICKLLAPYIYEACKASEKEMDQFLEKLLAELLKDMLSSLDPSQISNTSERDEETDDGTPCPVFGQSDLTITLDDETYDKLMQNAKKSGQEGGMGIMIKREHPKDDEEGKDGKQGSGSGNGQQSDSSDQNGTSSKEGEGKDAGDKDGKSKTSDKSESKDGKSNSADGEPNYSKEYSKGEGGSDHGNQEHGSHSAGGGRTGSVEQVLDEMKEAASKCRAEAAEMIDTINKSVSHASVAKNMAPVVADTSRPISEKDVKDICNSFKENKRQYKLDQLLPPVLNARAKAFRKKNERYFRSLSTPSITNLSSGGVDPSLIYGLTFGETNVFRKIGIDKKFNGCVYVLVDNSGSMCGNKRSEACKAAAIIEEGFKGIIPMKIVAFDYCGSVMHEVVKGWDESQKLNCCWNFAIHGRNGCGNDDDKDILIAQRELLARSEEKKLLIVLSDGAPSDVEATKRAIENTRKKGISVFGIYFEEGRIGSDAKEFKHMYQKDYVCTTLDQVDAELTKLMIKFSRS